MNVLRRGPYSHVDEIEFIESMVKKYGAGWLKQYAEPVLGGWRTWDDGVDRVEVELHVRKLLRFFRRPSL